ncbi:alpha/beta fold hydrolase [Ferrovibrio sp.]|uniref:alpha/beta fold hydrolase n=1 Tax=Ferrovibrio sp. TaxID=1917215 RepID=UPI0035B38A3B
MASQRHFLERYTADGRVKLSYVDFNPDRKQGEILLCLHGRSGSARNFAGLAKALAPDWRVIGLDQRGHGWSDQPEAAQAGGIRNAFVADAMALLDQLAPGRPVAVLGHSMGGINAYHLAAKHPARVKALIVEDIGARLLGQAPAIEPWPLRWDSLAEMIAFMQASPFGLAPLLLDSIVEHEDGWGFRFEDTWYERQIRPGLHGDFSAAWAAVACPVLLLHGGKSWAVSADEIARMAALNPHCQVLRFPEAGHIIHDDAPAQFAQAVRDFLLASSGA